MYGKNEEKHRYDDIINMPHYISHRHPQMDIKDRAAQFAPFAALTGHSAAIKETSRLTEEKVELDENCKAMLDGRLQILQEQLSEKPVVEITYFIPDSVKTGGAYVKIRGSVRKIDEYEHRVVMTSGENIPMDDIMAIESVSDQGEAGL
ncbi:MAG: hypothetical protein PHR50_02880 [Lachnospiraceae bacterium]|nr:hypothetical protein [Lachnospiraceae bacterium]